MPYRCDSYYQAWTFQSTEPPLQYVVLFLQLPGETNWKVTISDITGSNAKRVAATTCLHEPTLERAELILRCHVDTDKGLYAFIAGATEN